jgi:hypothetical protein
MFHDRAKVPSAIVEQRAPAPASAKMQAVMFALGLDQYQCLQQSEDGLSPSDGSALQHGSSGRHIDD